jgi:penicillin-binding protein 1B
MQAGRARVADTAKSFGLPRPAPYPALALGTTEVSPVQIAVAYAAFANGGRRIQPNAVARSLSEPRRVGVATGSKSQFETEAQESDQVIQPGTAFMITDMLQGVIEEGTARAARGQIPKTAIAGKTGTSRDGWFVGYSKNLVCAVWIGFDDNQQLGLTGAEAA